MFWQNGLQFSYDLTKNTDFICEHFLKVGDL